MGPRLRKTTLVLGIVGATLGCTDEALVNYTMFEEPGFEVDLLVVEFTDRRRTVRLTSSDFDTRGSGWDTRDFETSSAGSLETRFWLVDGADTLSQGQVRLDLRRDFRWNLSFRRAESDPTTTCFGCAGRVAFELAPSLQEVSADSLWVVWGGNSISNPVVF